MASGSSKTAVIIGVSMNFCIACSKFIAAYLASSSALFSEGIHSLADTINQALLLLGFYLAKRAPSRLHPLGYGKEIYFWSFIVALVIFFLGGVVSIYQGVESVLHSHPLEDVTVGVIIIGVSLVFETIALYFALRAQKKNTVKKKKKNIIRKMREAKDPTLITIIAEDSMAIAGLIIVLIGIGLATLFDLYIFDGIASILVGLVLAVVGVFLMIEARHLLLGEGLLSEEDELLIEKVASLPYISKIINLKGTYYGPHDLIILMEVVFSPERKNSLEQAIDELELEVKRTLPHVSQVYIEAKSITHAQAPNS